MKNSLHTADLNPGPLKQIFMKQMLFLWASRPRLGYHLIYNIILLCCQSIQSACTMSMVLKFIIVRDTYFHHIRLCAGITLCCCDLLKKQLEIIGKAGCDSFTLWFNNRAGIILIFRWPSSVWQLRACHILNLARRVRAMSWQFK